MAEFLTAMYACASFFIYTGHIVTASVFCYDMVVLSRVSMAPKSLSLNLHYSVFC